MLHYASVCEPARRNADAPGGVFDLARRRFARRDASITLTILQTTIAQMLRGQF
jgi:hypothetical protein